MNRVFRVVFNKVRGTLLVVNELTSSVSSKGRAVTTVALSTALLSAASGASAEIVVDEAMKYSGSSDSVVAVNDEEVINVQFGQPAHPNKITNPESNENYVGLAVAGKDITLSAPTINFNGKDPATPENPVLDTFHAQVLYGGHLTIEATTLNVGQNADGDGNRGFRLIGAGNQLDIFADVIHANVGDEFVHVRNNAADSVANIGSAERRVKEFVAKTGWGKDDYGVALLQANEGGTINLFAENATFDGPTNINGGVFGSGSHGTVNVDVSNTLTIAGNIVGTYGTIDSESAKTTALHINVKAHDLQMTGDVNAGNRGEGKSNHTRTTYVDVSADQGVINGHVNAYERGNITVTGVNTIGGNVNAFAGGNITVKGTETSCTNIAGATYVGNGSSLTIENANVDVGIPGKGLIVRAVDVAAGTLTLKNAKINMAQSEFGAAIFGASKDGKINLENVDFVANYAQGAAGQTDNDAAGGALYTYAPVSQNGGSYVSNNATVYSENALALGGAVMVKGAAVEFTDVQFTNNAVEAPNGKAAFGGAIMADFSDVGEASVAINVTKDMTYTGNTVDAAVAEDTGVDTHGYHTLSSTAGGFLFLDRGSSATFNIENGATLTIGSADAEGDTDSIASSIPDAGTTMNGGKIAAIEKAGAGKLVINSSLDKYYGNVTVSAGELSVTKPWTLHGAVTVAGGTLRAENFTFGEADEASNVQAGSLSMTGGSLITQSGNLFVTQEEDVNLSSQAAVSGGTLVLTDTEYSQELSQQVGALPEGVSVEFTGTMLSADGKPVTETAASDLITTSGAEVVHTQVTAKTDTNLTLTQGQNLGVKAVELTGSASEVTVGSGSTLTLAGSSEGGALVKSATSNVALKVTGGTLNVGVANSDTQAKGELPTLVLESDGNSKPVVNLVNFAGTVAKLESPSADSVVNVGSSAAAADVVFDDISAYQGMIFVDPAWANDPAQNVVENASKATTTAGGQLGAKVVVGRNAIGAIDATADEAVSQFNSYAQSEGASWGPDGVTAALYLNNPLEVSQTGGIMVDGSLTAAPNPTDVQGKVTVAANGLLMINQATLEPGQIYITGADVVNNGTIYIVNPSEGEIQLSENDVTGTGSVVNNNRFMQSSLDGAKIVNKADADGLLGAFASAGIQQTLRRADQVLSFAIADHTAFNAYAPAGLNLWVDVQGEHAEADKLDNGAKYKSNIAYATFGADVGVTPDVRLGAAIEYGNGKVRSGNYSLHNDVDTVGVGAYASWQFADKAKVVADVAYAKSNNDITSGEDTMFDQKVDGSVMSAGAAVQYLGQAGAFSVIPSIGLRVSKLKTDDMHYGSINVGEQSQTIVQMPVAVRITAAQLEAAGWSFAPSAKFTYVPTFGDDDLTRGTTSQTVLDMSPVQADLGLRATKANFSLGAHFILGGGKDGSSTVGGKIDARYSF